MTEKQKFTGRSKWLYVALGIVMFICLGTVYSWSVFRSPFEEYYSLSASQSGLPYLFFLISYTVFMLLSGKAVDKFNPKVIIFLGGLMVGFGWIMSGIIKSFFSVIFFYGIVSGSGVGIAYGVPIKVVSNWFTKKKGLALGLLLSGFGLSPFITAPVIETLIEHRGINSAFIYIGIAFLIIVPLIGLFFKHPANLKHDAQATPKKQVNGLIKDRRFIGLWICFTIGTTIGLMVIGVTSQIGQQLFDLNAGTAAYLLSVFAIFNALGRPIFGYITDRFSPFTAIIISFILIALASSGMLITGIYSTGLYIICLSVLWMNLGAWLSIAPTATGLMFDPKNYSRNYGILFTAYGVGAFVGTPLAGFLKTIYGSYRLIFFPSAILAIIGIAIAYVLIYKKRQ